MQEEKVRGRHAGSPNVTTVTPLINAVEAVSIATLVEEACSLQYKNSLIKGKRMQLLHLGCPMRMFNVFTYGQDKLFACYMCLYA